MFERVLYALKRPRTHFGLAIDQLHYHINLILYKLNGRLHLIRPVRVDETSVFCENPFKHFEVKHDGNVYLCCSGWIPHPIGNLKRSHPEEIWNSRIAQDIRRSIFDGSFAYCNKERCRHLQSYTLPKHGVIKDVHLQKIIKDKILKLDRGPHFVNLCYDKSCNLYCPSCRTGVIRLKGKKYAAVLKMQEDLLAWEAFKQVKVINVTGSGDVFAGSIYRNFLQKFDPNEYPNLRFRLGTNGLLLSEEMWNSIKNIHGRIVSLNISIDAATPETYEKLRRGGKFNTLLERLAFVRKLKEQNYLPFLHARFCVQLDNYKEMPDFVKLCKEFKFDTVNFARISDWGTYTPREMKRLSVHKANNPEHQNFLDILNDPIFLEPIVDMGELNEFMPANRNNPSVGRRKKYSLRAELASST